MTMKGSIYLKQGEPGDAGFKYVEIKYTESGTAEGSIASLRQVLALTLKGKWKGGDNSVDHVDGNYKIGTGFGSTNADYLFWEWSSINQKMTLFEIVPEAGYGDKTTTIAEFSDMKKGGSKFMPAHEERTKAFIFYPGNNMTKGSSYWEDNL